jgi:hypothetical protein
MANKSVSKLKSRRPSHGLKNDGSPKRKPGRKRLSPCVRYGRLASTSRILLNSRANGTRVSCKNKPGRKRVSPCKYGVKKHSLTCKKRVGRPKSRSN